MPVWLIIIVTTVYILGLFYIAWKGDQSAKTNDEIGRFSGVGYALALAVYCTSWTYFGAVGTAASDGWDYIWIYAGPAVVFLFVLWGPDKSLSEGIICKLQRQNLIDPSHIHLTFLF